jgi:P-type E1-E2 ATPase
MFFEFVEDIKRWKQDGKENRANVPRAAIAEGIVTTESTQHQNLAVGHILKLDNNQPVPADCVVLSTGEEHGMCYISTESLDGEQNLKPKLAPNMTQGKLLELSTNKSKIKILNQEPDKNLFQFEGDLSIEGSEN